MVVAIQTYKMLIFDLVWSVAPLDRSLLRKKILEQYFYCSVHTKQEKGKTEQNLETENQIGYFITELLAKDIGEKKLVTVNIF